MRILKFIFFSLLVIGFLVGSSFLLAREVLLLWGVSQVKASASALQAISRQTTQYARECRQKGTPATDRVIAGLQLRFTSPRSYVLEVICSQFPLDPIVIEEKVLPPFVSKRAGSSGMIWGVDRSGVGLEVFGRKQDVLIENREIKTAAAGAQSYGVMPPSSCQGYGYFCCQGETESGVGELYSEVQDCPKSCFASCRQRPVVLSFTSDPYPTDQRQVQIRDGESVTFSYVASYSVKKDVEVAVEFGDGEQEKLTTLSSTASHTYHCGGEECRYSARIVVKDLEGNSSAETPLSRMEVIVSR